MTKDSVVLSRYGMQEKPKPWQPEALEIRTLKALVARLDSIEKDLQRERNRQEKAAAGQAPQAVLGSLGQMIGALDNERQQLETLIQGHIDSHKQLKGNKALLESIPGVGKVIATRMLMVIGSRQFDSASQCSAYLGLAPCSTNPAAASGGVPGFPRPGTRPSVPSCTWRQSWQRLTTQTSRPNTSV